MIRLKEEYLCSALDKFKDMINNGECSKADIAYFYNLSKYELERRDTSISKRDWLTKKDASLMLGISISTFDRLIQKGLLSKGKKIIHQHSLVWKCDEVEELKQKMFIKVNA